MNISQIKETRDEAAAQILGVLLRLEKATDMVVSFVDIDSDSDDEGRNTGANKVKIQLELE
jgi:hypothetical protein